MSGPIREVFKTAMRGAGRMGYHVGHLDSANLSIGVVLDDARANLKRNPAHILTAEAVRDLEKAQGLIDGLSSKLEFIGSGEDG